MYAIMSKSVDKDVRGDYVENLTKVKTLFLSVTKGKSIFHFLSRSSSFILQTNYKTQLVKCQSRLVSQVSFSMQAKLLPRRVSL